MRYFFLAALLLCQTAVASSDYCEHEWGFFGHRRINRLAIFTLPQDMIPFFKKHIDYITDHAVDPDKRRYATRHEAVRHYIDLDVWGSAPYDNIPRDWTSVLTCYASLYGLTASGDSVLIYKAGSFTDDNGKISMKYKRNSFEVDFKDYKDFFKEHIQPQYYEDEWVLEADIFCNAFSSADICRFVDAFVWVDEFSEHGILPYHLEWMQFRLTEAFRSKDEIKILRYATEIGHYIGDAHVPLHTTENYNGQLTNQDGIHAFWESRIPELFADDNYDFFVGPAEYIENTKTYFWEAVLKSHSYVDTVLIIERNLRESFPVDLQYCYDERLGRVVRTQCREFAAAYSEALRGQVEERFRASIHALGSIWYTAWIDAGQPELLKAIEDTPVEMRDQDRREMLEAMYQKGEVKGRVHEN